MANSNASIQPHKSRKLLLSGIVIYTYIIIYMYYRENIFRNTYLRTHTHTHTEASPVWNNIFAFALFSSEMRPGPFILLRLGLFAVRLCHLTLSSHEAYWNSQVLAGWVPSCEMIYNKWKPSLSLRAARTPLLEMLQWWEKKHSLFLEFAIIYWARVHFHWRRHLCWDVDGGMI